jgi:hypothetical protein
VKEGEVENGEKIVFANLELFVSNAGMAFIGQFDDRREPPEPGGNRPDRHFWFTFCSSFEIDFSFGNAGWASLLGVRDRGWHALDSRDCRLRTRN